MSFAFRLIAEDDEGRPAVVFEDSTQPAFVPLWEAVGVYDALYNSDGLQAREVSRTIAYGVDRLATDAALARLVPAGAAFEEALRFLERVERACVVHASASVRTA